MHHMQPEPLTIYCDCGLSEHQFAFRDLGDDFPEKVVSLEVNLCKRPFFKRLWHGLKYIFGHQSRFGAFDEVLIGEMEAHRILLYFADFLDITLVPLDEPDYEEEKHCDDHRFRAA